MGALVHDRPDLRCPAATCRSFVGTHPPRGCRHTRRRLAKLTGFLRHGRVQQGRSRQLLQTARDRSYIITGHRRYHLPARSCPSGASTPSNPPRRTLPRPRRFALTTPTHWKTSMHTITWLTDCTSLDCSPHSAQRGSPESRTRSTRYSRLLDLLAVSRGIPVRTVRHRRRRHESYKNSQGEQFRRSEVLRMIGSIVGSNTA